MTRTKTNNSQIIISVCNFKTCYWPVVERNAELTIGTFNSTVNGVL